MKKKIFKSHYYYLREHLSAFLESVGVPEERCQGLILAHGDKCYGYRQEWKRAGIPFDHGVAIYLLTYCSPYSIESRATLEGWIAPKDWVINNYERFKEFLPPE